MKLLLSFLVLAAALLLGPAALADTQPMSAQQALDVAKDGVDPSLRSHIVSVYGTGSPVGIGTWWVIFYDPSVSSHGHAVRVENGQIVRSYEAKGGVVYGDTLTFSPGQVHGIDKALAAAQDYAAKHALAYDNVRALLRQSSDGGPLRWRVQLLDAGTSRGFVFVDAGSSVFAMYSPPSAHPSSGGGDSVEASANAAGNDIKKTFLGIGGDLQQFFTGERTVDQ
jgi:hypothetical protein